MEWIETAKECVIPIPPTAIRSERQYSGKVSLRFSPFVHEEASDNAKDLGISLNQYINDAIVDYNAVCRTKSTINSALDCRIVKKDVKYIDR